MVVPRLVTCGAFNALAPLYAWRPDEGRHLPAVEHLSVFEYIERYEELIFSQPIDRIDELTLTHSVQSSMTEPTACPIGQVQHSLIYARHVRYNALNRLYDLLHDDSEVKTCRAKAI